MMKAPFFVEWLSRSSKKPSHLGQGDSEASIEGGGRGTPGLLFLGPPDTSGSDGPSTSSWPLALPTATIKGSSSVKSRSLSEEASPEVSRVSCGLPEGPGPEPHGGGPCHLPTDFTTKQISTLQSSFKRHYYLGTAKKCKLAGKMGLSKVQIKTWFQNCHMKLKRQLFSKTVLQIL
ncbi:LOW QUALITY PROTEIN: homeobox protein pv.1-like [Trichosurus vulpecula]|uniref:LOW QUALITY PROTEIN: homeobox protein pv.1-like n=1 Tax=Trichosurus vulpecula TaxID=9337 RepID=UPI00186B3B5F|nr:LOW QUALITY PROTEIN: homeobox protein pv.1-like [Trichosurus vulpecula]